MKKNILAFSVLLLTLAACDNASGGNKAIFPVDPAAQTDAHASHTEAPKPVDSAKTENKAAAQAETQKADSTATKTEAHKDH